MAKVENDHQLAVTRRAYNEFSETLNTIKAKIGDREPSIMEKIQMDSVESVRDELKAEIDAYLQSKGEVI